jgi:hypothetical protein
MMLAPVSQQLADFVWLNTSNETQTLSLSNFPLADSMFMVSPYQVHTRGSDSYGSKLLYDSLIWADESYWVSYKPNGEIMMEPIGNIMQSSSKKNAQSIASFGQIVNLLSANIRMEKGNLYFETTFLVDYSAAEGVAIFVHIVDASGQILAQADGDSLGGMIPSQAWRKGNTVTDIRTIPLNQITDINSVQLLFGFYNRWDGTRLPAVSSTDLEIQNDAVSIPIP